MIRPAIVGIKTAAKVHFQLFVSFFIVIQVVEQGQCIRENKSKFTAVIQVHPFWIKICFMKIVSVISVNTPSDK